MQMIVYLVLGVLLFILFLEILSHYVVKHIKKKYQNKLTEYGKILSLDDIDLYYRESGIGNNEPLILIHGFLESSYSFMKVFEQLAERYHVIAFDLPGFGKSSKSLRYDYSRHNQAQSLYKAIEKLGLQNLNLVGHSMGGEVALQMCYLFKNSIKKLILIDSEGFNPKPKPVFPRWVYRLIYKNYFIQFFAYKYDYNHPKRMTRSDIDKKQALNIGTTSKILKKMAIDNDSGEVKNILHHIEVETLIIWGGRDKILKPKIGHKLQHALPNSHLEIIKDIGHNPFEEDAEVFLKHLIPFL